MPCSTAEKEKNVYLEFMKAKADFEDGMFRKLLRAEWRDMTLLMRKATSASDREAMEHQE